jgi:hypothetical protein
MPLFDLLSATSIESNSYVGNVRTYVGTSNIENTTAFLAIFATPPNNPDESWIPLQASDRDIFYSIGSTNWPCLKARDGIFGRVDVSFIGNYEVPGSTSPSPAEIQDHFGLPDPEPGFYYFTNNREKTIMSWNAFRRHISGSYAGQWIKPNYKNLITGYDFDERLKQNLVQVVATKTEVARIGYYKQNRLEPISGLVSIDWMEYEYQLKKDKVTTVDLTDCVFGTLYFLAGSQLETLMIGASTPNGYHPVSNYLPQSIAPLMAEWEALRSAALPPSGSSPVIGGVYTIEIITYTSGGTELKAITANNDWWQNNPQLQGDIGYSVSHPMFTVNEVRSNPWHLLPQLDGSIGNLLMDSTRTIEIHAALDAGKYAVNELDDTKPRTTTLGYWIEKTGNLLGHRLDANGEIDYQIEKEKYSRKRLANPQWNKSQYSQNQFGTRGMVIPHLPNTYSDSGKLEKLYDVVYDIPQLLQALHDQVDIAQGIQHASQIRVKLADGSVKSFPDLLALQIENFKIASSMMESVTKTQISSLVTGAEVRELFGAIGTPVSQKFLTFKDTAAKKTFQIPYFGHQQGKESMMGGISTLKINSALQNGILLPKLQPAKSKINPFSVLKKKA